MISLINKRKKLCQKRKHQTTFSLKYALVAKKTTKLPLHDAHNKRVSRASIIWKKSKTKRVLKNKNCGQVNLRGFTRDYKSRQTFKK